MRFFASTLFAILLLGLATSFEAVYAQQIEEQVAEIQGELNDAIDTAQSIFGGQHSIGCRMV